MIIAHATFTVLTERAAEVGMPASTTLRPDAAPAFRRLLGWFATRPTAAGRAGPEPQRMTGARRTSTSAPGRGCGDRANTFPA